MYTCFLAGRACRILTAYDAGADRIAEAWQAFDAANGLQPMSKDSASVEEEQ